MDFRTARERLRLLRRILRKNISEIEIPALKALKGQMDRRIFRDGRTSTGVSMGPYYSAWRKVRARAGYQTARKDLEFTGDLRRSIQVGKSGGRNVLGFTSGDERKKAETNEAFIQRATGSSVFTASKRELEKVDKEVIRTLDKLIKRTI